MKKSTLLLIFASLLFSYSGLKAQTYADSLLGFDEEEEIAHILSHDVDATELDSYLEAARRKFIDKKYELGFYASPGPILGQRAGTFDCTSGNWDFEDGTLSGWNATGAVTVVNNGIDPYGAYPWVYPGGGNNSAKISSDRNCCKDGRLDRVINVPPTGTTLFNFHFAMSIFNFPHVASQAAKLWVEFYDQNGVKLGCPQYECFYSSDLGAVGVSTFVQTPNPASFYNPQADGDSPGSHPVTYSDWNTVSMDLSGYAGQSITAVFRVEWCGPGPDWAYVLIDIDCPLNSEMAEESCLDPVTATDELCGPANMSSYTWKDSNGSVLSTSRCFTAPQADLYTLECLPQNIECTAASLITMEYRVNPLPVPVVDAENGCIDELVSIGEVGTHQNPIVSWDWLVDGTVAETAPNFTISFPDEGLYDYDLTVVDDKGCSQSISGDLLVYKNPIADFTFTNVCDEETLLASSTADGQGYQISTYSWDYTNDGTDDATGAQLGYEYPSDGQYDLRHTVINEHGCSDEIIQQVTINALPVADFTVDPICYSENNVFANASSVVPVTDDAIVNYDWEFGDGATANTENTSHIYPSEGIYPTELLVTTNKGCQDSITIDAVVYPLPVAQFSATDVCLEFETEFTDLSTVSNNYTNNSVVLWDWDFNDGNSSNVQHPGHFYQNDGTYQVGLSVESNNGCQHDTTIAVVVHPKPVADFSGFDLYGCSPICPSIHSISTINGPSEIWNYYWTLSDGTTYANDMSFSDCFENLGSQTDFYGVELIVESNEGCLDTLNKEDYIEVFHNPIADFYFSPEEPNVMDPEVDFTNTSLYADFYQWTIEYYGQSSDINPTVEFPYEPDSYTTQLIAYTDEGCTDTTVQIVTVLDKIIFYVPNTFTPDGDKFNETFQPVFTHGFDPQSFTLYIFNRWGETVFESHDTTVGWPGTYGLNSRKLVKEGTYVWKIEFKETMSDKRHVHTGHVNVLR